MLQNQSSLLNLKEYNEKFNILYNLERECKIYNFVRRKHYKDIPQSVMRNRFSNLGMFYRKYVTTKDSKTYTIKPLIWVKVSDKIILRSYPTHCHSKIEFKDYTFILIDESEVPFYFLRKYGRKKGADVEIFSELKRARKELDNVLEEAKKQYRKTMTKLRRKNA